MSKQLTLNELKAAKQQQPADNDVVKTEEVPATKANGSREMSIGDLAKNMPGREKEEIKENPIVEEAVKDMFSTLDRKREGMQAVKEIIEEQKQEAALDAELAEDGNAQNVESDSNDLLNDAANLNLDDDEEVSSETIPEESYEASTAPTEFVTEKTPEKSNVAEKPVIKPKKVESTDLEDELDDLDNLIGELDDTTDAGIEIDSELVDDEETIEETRERFKKSLAKIKPVKNQLDLSEFTIQKTATSASVLLQDIEDNRVIKKADWVLYASRKAVTVSEAGGVELDALAKTMRASNNINSAIAAVKFAYNHIVDNNKPPFEAWCKSIKYEDLESLYFALYKACYSDVNLLGRSCEKDPDEKDTGCGKTSIIETDVDSMVKYDNDEVKEDFLNLLNSDTTTYSLDTKSTMIMASDDIAISYTIPTVYTTLIQYSSLKPSVIEKYSELLNTMAYIDGFYKIDAANKQLIALNYKVYPNNLSKTILSKLKLYASVLKTLTSDQHDLLTNKLNALIEEPKVTYVMPKDVCPECGHEIPEENASMLDLLFTHRQLTAIKVL